MRMSPRLPIIALATSILTSLAIADTVALKSGEKIEGKILSQTEAEVTIETKSGGIVDQRTIKMAEVDKVSKESADGAAWTALKDVKLGNNSLPNASSYDAYITRLESFAKQYPDSKFKADAEKAAGEFAAEKKRVEGGEVKLSGKWISKSEAEKERYQINGSVALNYFREQAARGDVIGAMNTFDVLEKQYPGSRGYVEAIDTARKLLPPLKQRADALIAALPAELEKRKQVLEKAPVATKVDLKNQLDREDRANAAAYAQSEQQKLKYPPLLSLNNDALRKISDTASSDISSLSSKNVEQGRLSFAKAEEARAALQKKDYDAAQTAISDSKNAWQENEIAKRLEVALQDARTTAAATEETPAAETKSEEMKKENAEEKKEEPAKTASSEAPKTDASGTATASSENAAEAEAPAEEGSGLKLRILLLVVIVAAVVIGLKVKKSRQQASEEGESE